MVIARKSSVVSKAVTVAAAEATTSAHQSGTLGASDWFAGSTVRRATQPVRRGSRREPHGGGAQAVCWTGTVPGS